MTLSLRPYQEECLTKIATTPSRRQLAVMATGTGKTRLAIELIKRRGGRSVFLVNRDSLVGQTVRAMVQSGMEGVGVVQASKNQLAHRHVVATVQSFSQARRLAHYDRGRLQTLIVDECHGARSATMERVISYLDAPLTLGLTATPERSDGKSIARIFDLTFSYPITAALRDGYLVPPKGIRVGTDAMLDAARNGDDFDEGALDEALVHSNAPQQVAAAVSQFAAHRHTIVFVPRVATAALVVEACREVGLSAEVVSAKTPKIERERIYRQHRNGDVQVLATVSVLIEGYDDPRVDCVAWCRPTTHAGTYRQGVGRALRLHPAKTDAVVLDFVGATDMHDLCGIADLAETKEEKEWLKRVVPVETMAEPFQPDGPGSLALSEFTSYVELAGGRLHFIADGDRMFLPMAEAGSLMLSPAEDDLWNVHHRPTNWSAPLALIGEGLTIEEAQGVAEDLARRKGAMGIAHRGASWRKAPPTVKQLANLRSKGVPIEGVTTSQQAADLLFRVYIQRDRRLKVG